MQEISANVTQVLAALERGDADAAQRLFPLVHAELRALAGHFFATRRPGHTLQPTILVNDVFMKLVQKTDVSWEGRAHFFAVAAKVMRDLLVDHARAKRAKKRGGDWQRISIVGIADGEQAASAAPQVAPLDDSSAVDLIDLHDALARLGEIDPRQERIVELRYFAGLTVPEVAQVLGVSERTVMYDWRMARAWLRAQFEGEENT